MIRPGSLPRVRDQIMRHLTPGHSMYDHLAVKYGDWAEVMRANLRISELYWSSAEMSALSVGASETLPETWWNVDARPAPCGLLVFDGGITTSLNWGDDSPVQVDAVAWGPGRGGCMITTWVDRGRATDALDRDGMELAVGEVPPLIPLGTFVIDTGRALVSADIDPEFTAVAGPVAAAWLLMQQPTLVDRIRQHADRDVRRSYARAGRGEPDITYVTLRRAYIPTEKPEYGTNPDGSRYYHRWITSGHWREQPYGPGRERRRRIWIPDHIKGPEGAPMLVKKRVNVWRR